MCDMMNKPPQGGEPVRHLRVRSAGGRDMAAVEGFYKQHQPHNLVARDLGALMRASELQRLYMVEETREKQIVAAGACCAHCDGRFVEVGGAVVRWKGYGLQRLLTHIRTVQSLAMTFSDVQVFCIVDAAQTSLKGRMSALGFAPWGQPPRELIGDLAEQGHSGGDYLLFATERVEEHRQRLLELARSGVVRHIGTGTAACVSLDILLNIDRHFKTAHETAAPIPT